MARKPPLASRTAAQGPAESRSPPRKAPRQARSAATVAAAVEAAARILEESGHDGFSTNAVAERAGISIGSLYQYFPDKEAVIGALLLRETSLLIEEVRAAASHRDGRTAVEAFIAACIAHQFRRPRLARLLDFEEARLPLDADTRRVGEQVHELVVVMLSKPGLPHRPGTETAARDVVAVVKGMIDAGGQRGEIDHDLLAGRVRRAVFGFLAA